MTVSISESTALWCFINTYIYFIGRTQRYTSITVIVNDTAYAAVIRVQPPPSRTVPTGHHPLDKANWHEPQVCLCWPLSSPPPFITTRLDSCSNSAGRRLTKEHLKNIALFNASMDCTDASRCQLYMAQNAECSALH